jgi:hypothetical protein
VFGDSVKKSAESSVPIALFNLIERIVGTMAKSHNKKLNNSPDQPNEGTPLKHKVFDLRCYHLDRIAKHQPLLGQCLVLDQ